MAFPIKVYRTKFVEKFVTLIENNIRYATRIYVVGWIDVYENLRI